jgi:hypothetical protein
MLCLQALKELTSTTVLWEGRRDTLCDPHCS